MEVFWTQSFFSEGLFGTVELRIFFDYLMIMILCLKGFVVNC